jgi:hypothetical protein
VLLPVSWLDFLGLCDSNSSWGLSKKVIPGLKPLTPS